MKIIALEAENLKRLTAVRIEPDGNLVQITGKNGQGKTSVLDAIWWALDGTKNVQATPIRKGEERAIIRLDLGELKITRRFNSQEDGTYTTSITVENGEGARFSSPQSMLDKLLGELTFDPLAFTRMKPADQLLSLRSLVPDFDFDDIEAQNKADFSDRAVANREAKEAKAAAEEIGRTLPDEIPEPVTIDDLMSQWQNASEHNTLIVKRQEKRQEYRTQRDALHNEILRMQENLSAMDAEIEGWPKLEDPLPIEKIKNQLDNAAEINRTADAAARFNELSGKAKIASERSEALTKAIDDRKAAAQTAIAKIEMPGSSISIADGAVYLDGVPFDQASDAQQLQASIGIAMALNPKLKVIRVRDGSLLDDDAMKILAETADANDYQIWIERVDTSGTVGFVLEDGHVKGQTIEPEAKKPAKTSTPDPEKKKPAPSMFDADRG